MASTHKKYQSFSSKNLFIDKADWEFTFQIKKVDLRIKIFTKEPQQISSDSDYAIKWNFRDLRLKRSYATSKLVLESSKMIDYLILANEGSAKLVVEKQK